MKLIYYKNLDGLRAMAALMVMVFHFFSEIHQNSTILSFLKKISVFGQTGVTLFFVLSGFLITRILLSTKDKPHYFKNFYLRRTLRIFPLYYLALLLFYFVYLNVFDHAPISFDQTIFYFTYTQNFAMTFNWLALGPGHFWSLAVEEHFYLFWPLVIFLFNKENIFRIIIGIIIIALTLRIIMLANGYPVFYFTFTRFDALAIGALLSLLEMKQIFNKSNSKLFFIATCVISVPTVLLWIFFTGRADFTIQAIKDILISFTYLFLIAFILSLRKEHFLNLFILESKFMLFTGRISYGLYVYHPFAYALVNRFIDGKTWFINLIIGFLFSYLLATISYYFYEIHFLKLKKYFEYN